MGEFKYLKSVQDEIYLKTALGFSILRSISGKSRELFWAEERDMWHTAWHIVISRALDIYGLCKMEFDCLWVVVDVFEVVLGGCRWF